MMRPTVLKKLLLIFLLGGIFTLASAESVGVSVVVEIKTIDVAVDKIENVISEPIEILLGSLEDVLLVSAKYSKDKAILTVNFREIASTPADEDRLVGRVRDTVNSYMDKLPVSSVESISVSFAEPAEPISPQLEQPPVLKLSQPKLNRNTSEVETTISSLKDHTENIGLPSAVKSLEKRTQIGRYLGSIESSNEYLPVITTLPSARPSSDATGGKYFMSEGDEIVAGEIFGCFNNTGTVLTCRWRDRYGTGGVDFIFTANYTSFNGRWSIDGVEGAYKWSGIKVPEQ